MTTITDNFNRTNQTGLGSSSEGWSWSNASGTWDISSNTAVPTSASIHNNARADSDLASANHSAQASITMAAGASRDAGVAARFASAANTCYMYFFDGADSKTRLYKNIAGAYTLLATGASTQAAPSATVLKITCNGTSIQGDYGATTNELSVTDSSITTGTRTGIRAYSNLAVHDNFQAADIGSTGTIAVTLDDFTSAISGTTTVTGTIAVTLEDTTSSITGTTTIVGTIAQTLEDFYSSISGFIGAQTARLLALLGVGS